MKCPLAGPVCACTHGHGVIDGHHGLDGRVTAVGSRLRQSQVVKETGDESSVRSWRPV